jgi:hypothetical protein
MPQAVWCCGPAVAPGLVDAKGEGAALGQIRAHRPGQSQARCGLPARQVLEAMGLSAALGPGIVESGASRSGPAVRGLGQCDPGFCSHGPGL